MGRQQFSWAAASVSAFLIAAAAWSPSLAQPKAAPDLFDAVAEGTRGNAISAEQCRSLEVQQTAVWVQLRGKGWCLRYYAWGLGRETPVAAAWLHGDISGPRVGPAGHQKGLGPAAMIAQERGLAERYGVPFVFLARPGAYGSAGYHRAVRWTRLEADLIAAEIEALSKRYGVRSWVLGGHSGGGSLTAEMLTRRTDIRCGVVSSGAPDINAYLAAHRRAQLPAAQAQNAVETVARMPAASNRRIIVMGDPREKNVFWSLQQHYADVLKRHGADVTVVPLKRGRPPEFHSLVSLAEAATGLCARGVATAQIRRRLEAMPSQGPRESN